MRKHKFIIIRYSLLTTKGKSWNISRNHELEEYKRILFSPSRLSTHERLFQQVTFPSLVSQNPNEDEVTLLVLTSDELPQPYKNNLYKMLKPYPWAKVLTFPCDDSVGDSLYLYLVKELDRFDEKVCYSTTRLDDDDALAPNFNKMLDLYLHPHFSGFCISFPSGYTGIYSKEKNSFESFYYRYVPMIALGLSYINTYDPKTRAFEYEESNVYELKNHTKVDRKRPTILDGRNRTFLRTIHSESDTYGSKQVAKTKSLTEVEPDKIRKIFTLQGI